MKKFGTIHMICYGFRIHVEKKQHELHVLACIEHIFPRPISLPMPLQSIFILSYD